ncbi:DUF397 domain-containing protein [Kibdelosporangium aridum]|uniref:DUF397 domain-containing protein n=1 Tax=Kibdelosporangium aridum TaxID=2030 RepID=A0A428ZP13_KIBAR|nr:DUF397 domain-containing protein [Kibdelosporangium aridum]
MKGGRWRKSSYIGGGGSDCVEVDFAETRVAVRDSKTTDPERAFEPFVWQQFLRTARQP